MGWQIMTQNQKEKREELINTIVENCGLSISHATMRNEDLIPTFLHYLFILNPDAAQKMWKEDAELLTALCDKNAGKEGAEYWETDAAGEVCNQLFDELNAVAPTGYYFGSHIGDGSDYGFWQSEEEDSL